MKCVECCINAEKFNERKLVLNSRESLMKCVECCKNTDKLNERKLVLNNVLS